MFRVILPNLFPVCAKTAHAVEMVNISECPPSFPPLCLQQSTAAIHLYLSVAAQKSTAVAGE